jgi:hypothetical protein
MAEYWIVEFTDEDGFVSYRAVPKQDYTAAEAEKCVKNSVDCEISIERTFSCTYEDVKRYSQKTWF